MTNGMLKMTSCIRQCRKVKISLLLTAFTIVLVNACILEARQPSTEECTAVLPKSVENLMRKTFRQWEIVSEKLLGGLPPDYRKERPTGCPGVLRLDLYGDGRPVFAILIMREIQNGWQTKLLLAEQESHKKWKLQTIWEANDVDGVLLPVPPGEDSDIWRDVTIRGTGEGILYIKYEAYAIVFRWTGQSIEHVYVMD